MSKQRPTIAARLPKPDADAVAFVTAGTQRPSKAPAGTRRHLQAPAGRGATIERQDGRVLRKLACYISVELGAELAAFCRESGREQGHVVSEALRNFLAAQAKR